MDTSGLSTDAEANHDASIQATAAVFCFLSIVATALRVYSRKTKGLSLAVDDYLIFLSLTLAISESVMYAYGAKHYGLGRHLLGLDKQQLVDYAKVYYVSVSRSCIGYSSLYNHCTSCASNFVKVFKFVVMMQWDNADSILLQSGIYAANLCRICKGGNPYPLLQSLCNKNVSDLGMDNRYNCCAMVGWGRPCGSFDMHPRRLQLG